MSALPEHTYPCIEEGVVGLPNCIYLMLAVLAARGVVATCKQAVRLAQLVGNGCNGNPAV